MKPSQREASFKFKVTDIHIRGQVRAEDAYRRDSCTFSFHPTSPRGITCLLFPPAQKKKKKKQNGLAGGDREKQMIAGRINSRESLPHLLSISSPLLTPSLLFPRCEGCKSQSCHRRHRHGGGGALKYELS